MEQYRIVVDTDYKDFWRYNVVVMASVMVGDEQVELLKHRDIVAEVGAELKRVPRRYNPNRRVELTSKPAILPTAWSPTIIPIVRLAHQTQSTVSSRSKCTPKALLTILKNTLWLIYLNFRQM